MMMEDASFLEKYFDLDDLRCEEYRVKVRFVRNVPWSTEILLSEELRDCALIPRGTILSLSLHEARPLAAHGIVTILPTKAFSNRIRADLVADPTAVSLRDLSPHWYELGIKLSAIQPKERIAQILRMALIGRLPLLARAIFAPSTTKSKVVDPHSTIFGSTNPMACLDHTEEKIYLSTLAAKRDADYWLSGRRRD